MTDTKNEDDIICGFLAADNGDPAACVLCGESRDAHRAEDVHLIAIEGVGIVTGDAAISGAGIINIEGESA